MDEQESILREFLVECAEGIERLDQEFVALEKEPTNGALLASIFRTIHTIKGTCGFLGLPKLENVAHGAENILVRMRDKKMIVTPDGIDLLLEAVDAIKEILAHIGSTLQEPDRSYDAIRQKLDAFLVGNPGVAAELAPPQEGGKEASSSSKSLSAADSTIRVDVGLLDKLMNLVSELVLVRNQLLQRVRERDNAVDAGIAQRMNLITTQLQESVTRTRMQPIRNVWNQFPRVIRDLAHANGKEVELVMEGAETELDKTLLEAIKDPLTHIVRNAIDHGIETSEIRRARGKNPKGTLFLKAYHEGGQINIEIRDDGGGIDGEKVKRKAIDKGLITAEAAAGLSVSETLNLIFLPGLSTADKVTNVSGRGVGMDVVRNNIEKISGAIEIESRLEQGTLLKLRIPLTLAIIPALMIRCGRELFAIPQANLIELVRVDVEAGERIEMIHGAEFYRLRGELLPLIRLGRVLRSQKRPAEENAGGSAGTEETNVIVLGAGGQSFGLVVDEVSDREEIVVKPLSRHLKGLNVFAGATILGDGTVALILDASGIAEAGGLHQLSRSELKAEEKVETVEQATQETLLLFSLSGQDRYAIPLELVTRLEEFKTSTIEQAAGREVVQYRGDLLPLIRLDRVIGNGSTGAGETLPAILFSRNKKSVGLVVGQILDTVQEEIILHPAPAGKIGVRGSLVIQGLTTDLLDMEQIIESVAPGWLEKEAHV
ncbi:chemotaxis protein CheW [Candidatus Manganitrophus noduliformans]|uniref:histidine kinase n=1 Tax=Candidatus Manganitrophus noduliformans TaxID=2606439 RepID=A0A7X6DTF5_9BACT|nr:chemotaxis protein CheW [Candidatus Manganitrophus noduliformans]NKE73066.1 histidine kinase [Candidatus Manganitrophus noduliformans]